MNRHETVDLLQLRSRLTNQRYDSDAVDVWADGLIDVAKGEAIVAMRRACANHAAVNWFQFHAELDAHRHARQNRHDDEHVYTDCADCHGSGFRPIDDAGVTGYERCPHDRRQGPILPAAEGIPVMLVALETELRARGWDDERIATKLRSVAGQFAATYLEAIR